MTRPGRFVAGKWRTATWKIRRMAEESWEVVLVVVVLLVLVALVVVGTAAAHSQRGQQAGRQADKQADAHTPNQHLLCAALNAPLSSPTVFPHAYLCCDVAMRGHSEQRHCLTDPTCLATPQSYRDPDVPGPHRHTAPYRCGVEVQCRHGEQADARPVKQCACRQSAPKALFSPSLPSLTFVAVKSSAGMANRLMPATGALPPPSPTASLSPSLVSAPMSDAMLPTVLSPLRMVLPILEDRTTSTHGQYIYYLK